MKRFIAISEFRMKALLQRGIRLKNFQQFLYIAMHVIPARNANACEPYMREVSRTTRCRCTQTMLVHCHRYDPTWWLYMQVPPTKQGLNKTYSLAHRWKHSASPQLFGIGCLCLQFALLSRKTWSLLSHFGRGSDCSAPRVWRRWWTTSRQSLPTCLKYCAGLNGLFYKGGVQ